MRRSTAVRSSFWLAALAGALFAFAHGALANTPACDEIVQDPSIPTCTCICEASSTFPGCQGLTEGTAAATPNQCPDMLQGRRVLSRGDAVVVADPHNASSNATVATTLLYEAENDPDNPGLGVIEALPGNSDALNVGCQMEDGVPFPQQTRFARLFDLPYDMIVTLQPLADSSQVKSNCFAVSSTTDNLSFVLRSPNAGAPAVPQSDFQVNPQWFNLAIDDFDHDGFDDILSINIDAIGVWSAVDTADPGKGIAEKGAVSTKGSSGALAAPINEPTTGDFNGDGLTDVAWIGGDFPNKTGTLSVFFATICPGDIADTICAGAEPFEIILDPASKLFPNVSDATSTILLDDAPLTPTACGVIQSPSVASSPQGQGPRPVSQDVYRAGTVVLGNFEDNGLNASGAPTDELIVAYVSGSAASSSDPCSIDVQYWSFSAPPNSNPTAANNASWAVQRSGTVKDLFPEVSQALEFQNSLGSFFFAPTISLYSQASYLDWYGPVEQAVIGASGDRFHLSGGIPQEVQATSIWFPAAVSVSGTGENAEIAVCSASDSSALASPFAWGSAVGRFSTSTTVNPNNPSACNDFDSAEPGDCPYNPQIAMLLANDAGNHPSSVGVWVYLYTVQQSAPGVSGLECSNDSNVKGFLPNVVESVYIDGFSPMPVASLRAGSQLRAGDAFGDSVRVGVPSVARISSHTQPQIVVQAPPSLVDYVQPVSADSATPAIVNFTRAPNNYNAQVQFETSSEDTASTRHAHSFSASFTETLFGEVKLAVPKLEGVDVKNQETWNQVNESWSNEQLGTYSVARMQTGTTAGADDQVWWTQDSGNIFSFPVIGETVCPATLDCNDADPNTTGCTAAAAGVELTCSESGNGCACLSPGAASSLCPAIPTDVDDRTCTEQNGNVCCTLQQQPLNVQFTGPERVTRSSSAGAPLEWYHPKHEPAQVLSYPSSTVLIEARLNGTAQPLANLDAFTTGTNETTETMSWTCGTTSSVSTGTTTRGSFETDTSLTLGTPNLSTAQGGVNVGVSFDYQGSGSIANSNTSTVGQTASSSVALNLGGAGFLNAEQYSYSVEGSTFGTQKPVSVLDNPDLTVCPSDNPDCSTVEEVQADCTTTGPITAAFAADPTASGSGIWWQSVAPYLASIDVALNNPSRWRRVGTSDVANPSLQCRGPANVPICYTSNQPPTATDAASVWDALFYNMKGLLVTNGATTGPQRDTAQVGDEIFLQLRVSNYSLKTMEQGTRVLARLYRQQLDVNELSPDDFAVLAYATDASGNPLPAVPIGPAGLGDSDPIPVVSPEDGSATIPPFNLTTDPANDNISVATTSYTTAKDDACEYDNGVQTCNGAYYVYWATVWAEDAGGNLISELTGHGLEASDSGAFDPATAYAYITDVPKETVTFNGAPSSFSNNVGMFKKVFTILPEDSTNTLAAAAATGDLTLQRVSLVPESARLFEPVMISAQVVSPAAAQTGATVVFYGGDPDDGGESFDAEWLPHVRADDSHFVRVPFTPEACGTHEIFLDVTGGARTYGDAVSLLLDVDMDLDAAVDFLTAETQALTLSFPGKAGAAHKKILLRELARVDEAFDRDRLDKGRLHLDRYRHHVETLDHQGRIDPDKAYLLIGHASEVIGCIEAM